MKSVGGFLRNVVQRKEGGLVGRTLKVGMYTVRVEAHLGDGGFAAIYRARDISSTACFALKHMRLSGDPDALADCKTEVETMKRLRDHPNILTLRAVAFVGPQGAEQEAFLLLDLCQESLVDHMRAAGGPLPDSTVVTIFHSICKAVSLMHHQSPPMSHRDLKAENVLLHNNGTWVLCDFGSTTTWAGKYEGINEIMVAEENIRKYTTPAYRPPEMFDLYSREHIGIQGDIWALGVLLYYISFQQLPFIGDCKLQVLNGDYNLPSSRPEPLRSLIRALLQVSVTRRPSIDAIVRKLEGMSSSMPARALPASQPATAQQPSSNGNAGQPRAAAHVDAFSGVLNSRNEAASSSNNPAASLSASNGWAQGWDAGSWEQSPTASASDNNTPVLHSILPKEIGRVSDARSESATSRGSDDGASPLDDLIGGPASAPQPPDEPKPLQPPKPGSVGVGRLQRIPPPASQAADILGILQGGSARLRGTGSQADLRDEGHLRSSEKGLVTNAAVSSCNSSEAGMDSRGGSLASAEVAALQRQLAEANSTNRKLLATVKSQQSAIQQLQAEGKQQKSSGEVRGRSSDERKEGGADGGWVASFGSGQDPTWNTSMGRVQREASRSISRSPSPWRGQSFTDAATLSPDHPLKSLEASLTQLDPFSHPVSEPLVTTSATSGSSSVQHTSSGVTPLKKAVSRLGRKSRGGSFEAFEPTQDAVEMAADYGPHFKPGAGHTADTDATSGTPATSALAPADPSSDPPAQPPKRKGPWHRRTTSEPTPLDTWMNQKSDWPS